MHNEIEMKDAAELSELELKLRAIGRKCLRGNLLDYARTCEEASDCVAELRAMRIRLGEPGADRDDGEVSENTA
jgi:hypothetical protein